MAQTAGGVLVPVPQRIVGDRLVIENMVLRGITIRNCHIIGDGKGYALDVHDCYVEQATGDVRMSHCVVSGNGDWPAINIGTTRPGVS